MTECSWESALYSWIFHYVYHRTLINGDSPERLMHTCIVLGFYLSWKIIIRILWLLRLNYSTPKNRDFQTHWRWHSEISYSKHPLVLYKFDSIARVLLLCLWQWSVRKKPSVLLERPVCFAPRNTLSANHIGFILFSFQMPQPLRNVWKVEVRRGTTFLVEPGYLVILFEMYLLITLITINPPTSMIKLETRKILIIL